MNEILRLIAATLALTAGTAACAPPHFRKVDPTDSNWEAERAQYPKVKVKTDQEFPPTDPEHVAVYYDPRKGACSQPFGETGSLTKPPSDLVVLADLAIFRDSHPDHVGATQEMRQRAANLGADSLTDVRYTVIIGRQFIGGTQLVGWIYQGCAARQKE